MDEFQETTTKSSAREEVDRLPEIKVEKMTLFHGSATGGTKELQVAEETTLGKGVYLTSQRDVAGGYALRRAKKSADSTPTVYEIEVSNLRLADFRKPEVLEIFSRMFESRLREELGKPNLSWPTEAAIQETLGKIREKSPRSLKDLIWHHQDLMTEIIKKMGFDGLVAIEGGEGEEIANHDSYVIFDPQKAKIVKETLRTFWV